MFRIRIKLLLIFMVFSMVGLYGRLSYLQAYKSSEFSYAVRKKNIFEDRLEPLRGSFYDRNGVSLAEQVSSFNIMLDPLKFEFKKQDFIKQIKLFHKRTAKAKKEVKRAELKKILDITPAEVAALMSDEEIIKLVRIVELKETVVYEQLLKVFEYSIKNWVQEPLFFNLDKDKAIRIELEFNGKKGIVVKGESIRAYPQGNTLGHILGQLQPLQEDEVESLVDEGRLKKGTKPMISLSMEEHQYLLSTHELSNLWVGRTGLEYQYNHILRGVSGERCTEKVILKNSEGEVLPTLKVHYEIPPRNGKDLHLTIDIDLQKIAEEVMRESFVSMINGKEVNRIHVGSFVALNPQTGEVLAMVSQPDFDPNDLIPPVNPDILDDVILGKKHPNYYKSVNRAIQSRYPPGSPFKMFVAAMALEDGVISPDFRVFCDGAIRFSNGKEYKCHSRYGHQQLDVFKALKKSCNVFFYTIGMKMGTKRQRDWCKKFGFGELTGIDLPNEYRGRLPDLRLNDRGEEIENKYIDSHFSIGQVTLEITPLQMARAVAVFANGGYLVSPHIVKNKEKAKARVPVGLSANTIQIVNDGLWQVVNEVGGTANRLGRLEDVEILGKTGTADLGGKPSAKQPKWMDPLYRFSQKSYEPHAWFAGFAPHKNPIIAFAVISEHSGHGGDIAAPIAKKILERYFEILKKREEDEPKG